MADLKSRSEMTRKIENGRLNLNKLGDQGCGRWAGAISPRKKKTTAKVMRLSSINPGDQGKALQSVAHLWLGGA